MDDVHNFWAKRWSGPKLGWHKEDVNPHLQKYTKMLLQNGEEDSDAARIFVPLCGKSVDLAYLSTHSSISHVVGIDVVRDAAETFATEHPELALKELELVHDNDSECEVNEGSGEQTETCQSTMRIFTGQNLTFLIGDLFDKNLANVISTTTSTSSLTTAATQPQMEYLFDSIYDRASMVAIQPSLRTKYVSLMDKLLGPGGAILLVTLDRRETLTNEAKQDGLPFSINEAEVRQLYESRSWVESVTKLDEVNDLTTDGDRERWLAKGVKELYEIVFLIRKKK